MQRAINRQKRKYDPMKKLLTYSIFAYLTILTSCGKNIMNSDIFKAQSETQAVAGKDILGYWKSDIITLDQDGEINQQIFLQEQWNMKSASRKEFDSNLTSHDCSAVRKLESVDKIDAQIFIYFHSNQYYLVADLVYYTDDHTKLRCPGVLGQGKYISDATNYISLEDINVGVHLSNRQSGKFTIEFLR